MLELQASWAHRRETGSCTKTFSSSPHNTEFFFYLFGASNAVKLSKTFALLSTSYWGGMGGGCVTLLIVGNVNAG